MKKLSPESEDRLRASRRSTVAMSPRTRPMAWSSTFPHIRFGNLEEKGEEPNLRAVSYTHLRAHETSAHL
eukprot:12816925-Alexandrium_andersonii.AAC.1